MLAMLLLHTDLHQCHSQSATRKGWWKMKENKRMKKMKEQKRESMKERKSQ